MPPEPYVKGRHIVRDTHEAAIAGFVVLNLLANFACGKKQAIMINSSIRRIFLLASALVMTGAVFAQQASVSVEHVQSGIRVHISKAVSLRVVLDELCQQGKMRCEGTQHAEAFNVVPLSLSGSWQDVVARLTEGTGLNYVLRSPLAASNGELIVQPRSNAPAVVGHRPIMPAQPPFSVDAPVYIPPPVTLPVETSSDEPTDRSQTSVTPAGPASSRSPRPIVVSPGASQTSTGVALSPLTSEMPSGGSETSVLPFPDSSGRPIPASGVPAQVLPFPDSKGNPIPVKPGESASPFPTGGAK